MTLAEGSSVAAMAFAKWDLGPFNDWVRTLLQLGRPAPCRYCLRLAWTADAEGPVHRCCHLERDRIAAGCRCSSCAASEAHWRGGRRGGW